MKLPLLNNNKILVYGPEKDQTNPKIFCSHAPVSWANFYDIAIAQKRHQKGQRLDFQTLILLVEKEKEKISS